MLFLYVLVVWPKEYRLGEILDFLSLVLLGLCLPKFHMIQILMALQIMVHCVTVGRGYLAKGEEVQSPQETGSFFQALNTVRRNIITKSKVTDPKFF